MDRFLPPWPRNVVAGFVTIAAMTACTENTGQAGRSALTSEPVRQLSAALVDDATGPAAPVAGARSGGTITVLQQADFEHLDPAQNYVNVQQITALLFLRGLTVFREHPDGSFELVGDLATSTGVTNDGGRTWTYTLRDGLKYEDGRPITSQDAAYGIARSFSPDLPNGPHYIQQWPANAIDYNRDYQGPYDGGAAIPPGVETPDEKTIVFHFETLNSAADG